jgi:diacylglycerol kinase family enzyme
MPADQWDSIVFVSGDYGLLHEIINGLMNRTDWKYIRNQLTIGGIPGGNSNGLLKSLLSEINEDFGVHEAAWLVIRGQQ